MKKIIIDEKEFEIDCNALTHVKYKSFFKTGILKDMDLIQNYIIKQTIIANQLKDEDITPEEKINKILILSVDQAGEGYMQIEGKEGKSFKTKRLVKNEK